MTLARLLSHLRHWHFGAGTGWHRGRNAEGVIVKACNHCQRPIEPLLAGEMLSTGPQHAPAPVAGQPMGKVTRERRNTVVDLNRQSER